MRSVARETLAKLERKRSHAPGPTISFRRTRPALFACCCCPAAARRDPQPALGRGRFRARVADAAGLQDRRPPGLAQRSRARRARELARIRIGDYVIAGDAPDQPRADLNRPWRQIVKHAGLEDITLHTLRHTHASVGVGAGIGLPLVAPCSAIKRRQNTARTPTSAMIRRAAPPRRSAPPSRPRSSAAPRTTSSASACGHEAAAAAASDRAAKAHRGVPGRVEEEPPAHRGSKARQTNSWPGYCPRPAAVRRSHRRSAIYRFSSQHCDFTIPSITNFSATSSARKSQISVAKTPAIWCRSSFCIATAA